MHYQPTWQSLQNHPVPTWFHDAKLGVLIHWGPAAVPAWAPINGSLHQLIKEKGFEYYFANNPYSEWYYNTIRIDGSPSQEYHRKTYGPDYSYFDFASTFNETIAAWDPNNWAELFQQAGIQYVVFVAKHHDGFLLWPSEHPNPFHENYQTSRNVTGELTTAVRQRGMKMGLYYSGGLDWTFNDAIIRDIPSHFGSVVQSAQYVAYADAHWRELIDRYHPSILWGDIGCPAGADLPALFADYYNRMPDGVINDRFAQKLPDDLDASETVTNPTNQHFDYITPEYSSFNDIKEVKWETNRGIGFSFAYNLNGNLETHLSFVELVHLLVDVVSKNGNLMLGIGPMTDGTIPPLQRQRLEELGGWLKINGEAIFGTRPWVTAEAKTREGIPMRFTQKGNAVFVFLLGDAPEQTITIESMRVDEGTAIHLLGDSGEKQWDQQGNDLCVILPERWATIPARSLKISPPPRWCGRT